MELATAGYLTAYSSSYKIALYIAFVLEHSIHIIFVDHMCNVMPEERRRYNSYSRNTLLMIKESKNTNKENKLKRRLYVFHLLISFCTSGLISICVISVGKYMGSVLSNGLSKGCKVVKWWERGQTDSHTLIWEVFIDNKKLD